MHLKTLRFVPIVALLCSLLTAPYSMAADVVKLKGSGPASRFRSTADGLRNMAKSIRRCVSTIRPRAVGQGSKILSIQTVDFAASDAAMTDDEIKAVAAGVQLLPMTAGKIVLAYNLPTGPKELKLSRQAYGKIFLGQITKWNDPAIAKTNPGATLPDTDITVVRRADSSGTTFVFTRVSAPLARRGKRSRDWHNGELAGQ